MPSVREIAKTEDIDERYVARIHYSSLLAPDIIEKIVQGRQPVRFTVKSLKRLPSQYAAGRGFATMLGLGRVDY
ncbi:hypothetical protein [Dokdonella soli]